MRDLVGVKAPVALEQVAQQLHVTERSGRDGNDVATRADEAKYVTNVKIKTAVSDLQAHVVCAGQTSAQERDVTVPVEAGVRVHDAFGLARAAAGMDVIGNVTRLRWLVV